jgi:hypothetical protein
VTYRAELGKQALGQLDGFPTEALDALVSTKAVVVEYPGDPMRTFPTEDPYVRLAEFGGVGLVIYTIDDARETVTVTNITWTG